MTPCDAICPRCLTRYPAVLGGCPACAGLRPCRCGTWLLDCAAAVMAHGKRCAAQWPQKCPACGSTQGEEDVARGRCWRPGCRAVQKPARTEGDHGH